MNFLYFNSLHDVPNPDNRNASDFNFTRLGIRVPTVMISPWINKGKVVHDPVGPYNSSKFEHTSIAATIKKMFNIENFLTKRDAWAGTFEFLLQERDTPRTDCLEKLPDVANFTLQHLNFSNWEQYHEYEKNM